MHARKDRLITREQLDCFKRDIASSHPIHSTQAIRSLKECIERGGHFDCEATKISALSLYSALDPDP